MTQRRFKKKYQKRTLVITDSGFGGLRVLAGIYERLKSEPPDFPLNLLFAEALPKHCPGYPWKGYSLMPDDTTRVRVFNNFLKGADRHFAPDHLAVVCNTLSVIVRETDFYQAHRSRLSEIVSTGLEEFQNLRSDKDAWVILLGTAPTIQSGRHRQDLMQSGLFPAERIIPTPFPPEADYPLRIETNPHGAETRAVTREVLEKALKRIPPPGKCDLFLFLGCTHFGFIRNQYRDVLNEAGYTGAAIIDPNDRMTETALARIREWRERPSSETELQDNAPGIHLEIFSQFELTPEQIRSGAALIEPISPDTAQALKQYTLKSDIIEPFHP